MIDSMGYREPVFSSDQLLVFKGVSGIHIQFFDEDGTLVFATIIRSKELKNDVGTVLRDRTNMGYNMVVTIYSEEELLVQVFDAEGFAIYQVLIPYK